MANEFNGSGVTFGFNSVGSPSTYTTLVGVYDIPVPATEADEIEVSANDSTAKEFILGLGDPGTLTFPVRLRKATAGAAPYHASQTAFEAYANDGVLHSFKITLPGSTTVTYTFSGYVKKFEVKQLGPNTAAEAEASIRISGAITKA